MIASFGDDSSHLINIQLLALSNSQYQTIRTLWVTIFRDVSRNFCQGGQGGGGGGGFIGLYCGLTQHFM